MNVLYLIGFIQSLFVSSLILLKRGKRITDYILAFYILVIGFLLIFIYSRESGYYHEHPQIIILDILYWVWIGPLLYLYIDIITSHKVRLKPIHLVHLIPTIIVIAGFSDFLLESGHLYLEEYHSNSFIYRIGQFVWYYNTPVYYIICIHKLRKHKQSLKVYYSFTRDIDLAWLFYLAYGFAAYLIIGLVIGLLKRFFNIDLSIGNADCTWLVMVIYIFGIGYFGYYQKGIISNLNEQQGSSESSVEKLNDKDLENKIVTRHYSKSGLGIEEGLQIMNRLSEIMEKEKPYINFELNLRELAEKVETTPHKLSQVLNQNLKTNFFDYINNYRLEEVKKNLADTKYIDYKIISIAYDCGFNSKSAFHTIFKNKTTMTPNAYRQHCLRQKISN